MEAIVNALKSLKGWQLAFLVAILLSATAATFSVYTLVGGSGSVALDENQQLIPVRAGAMRSVTPDTSHSWNSSKAH